MKVLVTGGTGFVGSWVARELASRGHAVRLLVRPRSCLDNVRDIPGERFVGDITAAASVNRAVAGCEVVIHAAALARLRAGDRENLLAVNEGGTRNVLGAALRAGVRRAVFVASAGALGGTWEPLAVDERWRGSAEKVRVDYFVSKHRAEQVALELGRAGLPLVILRPGVTLGPGDVYHSSAGTVLMLARGKLPAYVHGGGSYCDVRDVAHAHAEALECGRSGESYLLGGYNLELGELARMVSRLSGVPMPLRVPYPLMLTVAGLRELGARIRGQRCPISRQLVRGARRYTFLDSRKANGELGYANRPLEVTVRDTLRWFLEHGDLEASTPELKALRAERHGRRGASGHELRERWT
ncbi:MAG TPA: NAD-dependent epimerase/dehydratase family protein [Myxococcaceae bacterium]|nr:NAD-dependent epimerase/dehydratase family protein [Myxococcaceae bacterium]